jgi:hypothetical protein
MGEAATLEYVLNTVSTVSQMSVPAAHDLQDALSRAVGSVTSPLHRLVPNAWPAAGPAVDAPEAVVLVGMLVLVVGYITLRRA